MPLLFLRLRLAFSAFCHFQQSEGRNHKTKQKEMDAGWFRDWCSGGGRLCDNGDGRRERGDGSHRRARAGWANGRCVDWSGGRASLFGYDRNTRRAGKAGIESGSARFDGQYRLGRDLRRSQV